MNIELEIRKCETRLRKLQNLKKAMDDLGGSDIFGAEQPKPTFELMAPPTKRPYTHSPPVGDYDGMTIKDAVIKVLGFATTPVTSGAIAIQIFNVRARDRKEFQQKRRCVDRALIKMNGKKAVRVSPGKWVAIKKLGQYHSVPVSLAAKA